MNCAVIYNPSSGRARQGKRLEFIVSSLKSKFETVDVFPTEKAGHAAELASAACGKYDVLVAIGGDGTLSEVVNGLAEKEGRPLLGYIPQGTCNDVAHSLGVSRNYRKAVSTILNGKIFKHDIFKANGKYGIYVCCAGLFTETSYATSQKHKKRVGKLAYFCHGVKKLFSTKSVDLELSYDGGKVKGKFAFMLILNSKSVAGFGINKKAKLDDGVLDILLIPEHKKNVSIKGAAKVASIFVFGFKRQGYRLRLNKFSVKTAAGEVINIDGEKAFSGDFDFEVLRQGLDIIVPKNFKN